MSHFVQGVNPYRFEERTRAADYERHPWQRFDRVAFALRALRVLIPRETRIVVFRSNRLQVTQGLDLARGSHARWVMLGIPWDASAESIVLALAQLDGLRQRPYALEATLEAARAAAHGN
ncbi:MAG TPA: hypothetical protein VFU02_02425 [Polyangiaceae bacterium]|nr:hypothetical protein [Polyangiaceae bacterium]